MSDKAQQDLTTGTILVATRHVDLALMRVLVAESLVFDRRRNQMADAVRKVREAIELALGCHRRGGCTSQELAAVEEIAVKIEELSR